MQGLRCSVCWLVLAVRLDVEVEGTHTHTFVIHARALHDKATAWLRSLGFSPVKSHS